MIEKLSQIARRLLKPKTLEEALGQIVSPKLIDSATREVYAQNLVETIARKLLLNKERLLSSVGERLKIQPVLELQVPSDDLIRKTGHNAQALQSLCILPQSSLISPSGYALVIADPNSIRVEEFRDAGIQVFLSLGSEIETCWKKYDWRQQSQKTDVSQEHLESVIEELVISACKLGSQAVFVGYPTEDSYEFLAKEQKYSGKLHPAIYRKLVKDLPREEERFLTPENPDIQSISMTLTKSSFRSVVCLTWEGGAELKELTEEEKQVPLFPEKPKHSCPEARESSKPSHIMLIDDDERFSFILGRILESKGWSVAREFEGKAALKRFKDTNVFDLILCDVHLPNLDGPSVVEKIRSIDNDVPIIMLTSDDDELLEAELALLGIDAFLRKHEDPRILLAWINNLLTRKKIRAAYLEASVTSNHLTEMHSQIGAV